MSRAVGVGGNTVDYSYDSAGNLVTADAGTSSARLAYDTHGRLTRAGVDGSTTEYQYGGGQPVLRVADGMTTQYATTVSGGSSGAPPPAATRSTTRTTPTARCSRSLTRRA
jgi:YD repeat-containing protein